MAIKLRKHLRSLKLLVSLAALKKNAGLVNRILSVCAGVKDIQIAQQINRHLLENRDFSQLVSKDCRTKPIGLKTLKTFLACTLGRCYAEQLIIQGITPTP